jgi:hypothetical protein
MFERLYPYRWWILGFAVLAAAGGGTVYVLQELKQGDPRWGKKLLGQSNKTTIAAAGCLLTSMTLAHNLLHHDNMTPDVANDLILAAGGYSGANMITAPAARALRLAFDPQRGTLVGGAPAALAAFAADALRRGGVAIVHVTYDEDPEGDHFIVATKLLSDGSFEVFDPGPGRFNLNPQLQGPTPRNKFYYPVKVTQLFRA